MNDREVMQQALAALDACPFCGNEPSFSGKASEWKDDYRYVELSLGCCVLMTEQIGWRQAREMTHEAKTAELRSRLQLRWNTRAALEQQAEPVSELQKRYLESEKAFQQQAEPIGWLDGNDKLAEFMHRDLKADHDKRGSATPKDFTIPVYTAPPQQQAEPVHGDIRALKYRIHELEGEVMGYKRMLDVAEAVSQPQQQAEPCQFCGLVQCDPRCMWIQKDIGVEQAEPVACKTLCELCVKRDYDFCANVAKTTPIIISPTPPKRQWVGLTDEDFLEACQIAERGNYLLAFQRIQIKLKEKNT